MKNNNKNIINGSHALMRCLLEEKVDTIFGYPGGAIMPIYDALYDYKDRVNHILTRHEQGATHAAQGYSRVSGKTGVVFATSGPGATNLITGIADALIDSTPIVCITGQVHSHLLGTDAFQETDVVGISTPVTKWNYQITKAEEIPNVMSKAFYICNTNRPGPVLIDITKDAQFDKIDFSYKKSKYIRGYNRIYKHNKKENDKNIEEAAKLINEAKKPYLIWGQGIILGEAEKELKDFIEKGYIPSASTILGLSGLPSTHKLHMGMLGMHGNYSTNKLTNETDVLIAVGMRFDDRVTGNLEKYAKNAKIIHLEIDPSEVDKNIITDISILGNAKNSLKKLTSKIVYKDRSEWADKFNKLYQQEYEQVIEKEIFPPKDSKIKMGEVVNILSDKTKGNAIVVTDVGQHQMVTCRYYKFNKSKSCITSGGLGTMGFCLPAAMGAKTSRSDREVIAIIGDGGFQMTIQELGTICQYNIKLKIVILNNNFLGMVRQWQELFFDKRYSFVEMENPNFIKITEGYGIKAIKVEKREELKEKLDEFLSYDKGPILIEVIVEKEGKVFPMIPQGAGVAEIRLK